MLVLASRMRDELRAVTKQIERYVRLSRDLTEAEEAEVLRLIKRETELEEAIYRRESRRFMER